ncbi:hypothetical protein AX15_003894 [Amanita polypyramis BW_CC]|nr:hypothetical protein AX15_003894 [Amanita polypyramis BW_CC]
MRHLHAQWHNLLGWLESSHRMSLDNLNVQLRQQQDAGYGLFSTCLIQRSTPLFTIPASALPNILTLSPHYPRSDPPLTAIQLISLHLALHRPKPDRDSSDPLFGPYISILPTDFAFHPLGWLRGQDHGLLSCVNAKTLLDMLPTSVMDNLNRLSDRFETDWKRVSGYLVRPCHLALEFLVTAIQAR